MAVYRRAPRQRITEENKDFALVVEGSLIRRMDALRAGALSKGSDEDITYGDAPYDLVGDGLLEEAQALVRAAVSRGIERTRRIMAEKHPRW